MFEQAILVLAKESSVISGRICAKGWNMALYLLIQHVPDTDTLYLVTGDITWLVFLGLIYPVQIGKE